MTRYVQGPQHAARSPYRSWLPWLALGGLLAIVAGAIVVVIL